MVKGIIINYTKYSNVLPKTAKYIDTVKYLEIIPSSSYIILLIVIMEDYIVNNFDNTPKYIENHIDDALYTKQIFYNEKLKLYEINNSVKYMNIILPLLGVFPYKYIILIFGINLPISTYKSYINLGFQYPALINKSPVTNLTSTSVALIKYKGKNPLALDILKYILKQNKFKSCKMNCVISSSTVNYLQTITYNKNSRKEIGGTLKLNSIKNDTLYFTINKTDIATGGNEYFKPIENLYSFHTHPYKSYIHYNVKKAWPSVEDYLTFLSLIISSNAIFHIVSSLEGLYIITLNQKWSNDISELENIDKNTIKEQYKITNNKDIDPKHYIKIINNTKLKLFYLYHFNWKEPVKFTAYYSKIKCNGLNNCFISTDNMKLYNKIMI